MKLNNAVVFVTGANRGLGLAFVKQLQARGVRKIYAAARDPSSIDAQDVVPVKLDVSNAGDVAAAAAQCGDVTVLINNAGIANVVGFQDASSIDQLRSMFEVNVVGPVALSQAFAPILKANGGGAIVNVLSAVTWIGSPPLGPYAASKAAAWSFTNTLRTELSEQGTQVLALHMGFMDTDMARGFDFPKVSPQSVAQQTLDALEAGEKEVLADDITRGVKLGLSAQPGVYLSPVGE
jgi:NAD(P)-dependent dehydrogenase (short-subunit alcohol dehydrogenase family)